jgi:hypothetical protein
VHRYRRHNRWFAPGEASLTVGAGVTDYVGSTMRNATEIGAEWDVRLTIGTRSVFAFEAGYEGTYNKFQSPVEGRGSVAPWLSNNGFDGSLRLNLLPFRFQPYIFGGIGYNRASMHNRAESPAAAARFNSGDDQLMVPSGGGVALYLYRHATLDTRFTYRAMFLEDLDRLNKETRFDRWVVTGRFGYTF